MKYQDTTERRISKGQERQISHKVAGLKGRQAKKGYHMGMQGGVTKTRQKKHLVYVISPFSNPFLFHLLLCASLSAFLNTPLFYIPSGLISRLISSFEQICYINHLSEYIGII